MTTFDLRIGYISVDCPRLQVQVIPRSDVPMDSISMIVHRTGAPSDLATYVPINIAGNVLTFQLDALVFDNAFGRYQGALASNGVKYQQCEFEYTAQTQINPAQQLCTVEPYRRHHEFARPNWSGTGVAGPGTFIGLKDTPKQYTGCAGYNVFVNEEETGLRFLPGGGAIGTLNGLVGDVVLAAGAGVSVVPNPNTGTITLSFSGVDIGVTSVNGLDASVEIVAGDNITVAVVDGQIVISATGSAPSGNVNNQTGTAYAPLLTDNNGLIIATNASAVTVTISLDSTTDFPVLGQFLVQQGGAGTVTLVAGAGVTLQTPNGAATTSQYDVRGALKTAANTWVVL